jgi:hypothetical protein
LRQSYIYPDHQTSDTQKCPQYNKQKTIDTIKAKRGLSYYEVMDTYKVTTNNYFEVLEKIDDFPTLQESFANVVKYTPPKRVRKEKVQIVEQPVINNVNRKGQKRKHDEEYGTGLKNVHATTEFERFMSSITKEEGIQISEQLNFCCEDQNLGSKTIKSLFKILINALSSKQADIENKEINNSIDTESEEIMEI